MKSVFIIIDSSHIDALKSRPLLFPTSKAYHSYLEYTGIHSYGCSVEKFIKIKRDNKMRVIGHKGGIRIRSNWSLTKHLIYRSKCS